MDTTDEDNIEITESNLSSKPILLRSIEWYAIYIPGDNQFECIKAEWDGNNMNFSAPYIEDALRRQSFIMTAQQLIECPCKRRRDNDPA